MAQEFLLVPKSRYDYLMKQVESKQQTGGAVQPENDTKREVVHAEPTVSGNITNKISDEGTTANNDVENKISDVETDKNRGEKPNLYVERSLSNLDFTRNSKKRKSTDYHDKGKKKRVKSKWINYLV